MQRWSWHYFTANNMLLASHVCCYLFFFFFIFLFVFYVAGRLQQWLLGEL